jgi:predicted transposase YbfD/YdcC
MTVKGNHPLLLKKIAAFFANPCLFDAEFGRAETHDVGHGRIETRRILTSSNVPPDYTGFPGVRQLFCLARTVVSKRTGEVSEETTYGITSLSRDAASPARLLSLIRGHWTIENRSHWVRDVTFDEDRSQVRCGSLPQVMAAIRNASIGLIRLAGYANVAAACRRHAARPEEALRLLGLQEN